MNLIFSKFGLTLVAVAALLAATAIWQAQSAYTVSVVIKPTATSTVSTTLNTEPNLMNGLVGWWTFDGNDLRQNAVDRSGQGSTGYLSNFTSTTTVPGKLGQGLKFTTGIQEKIQISGTAVDNLTKRTVTAWIKPSSFGEGSFGRIVDKQRPPAGGCNCGWFFILDNSNVVAGMQAGQWFAAGTNNTWTSSSNTIALNTWQFVALTYDSSSSSNSPIFYVNAIAAETSLLAGSNGSGSPPDDSSHTLAIGNRPNDLVRTFDGIMDDVRIYNRVLSAEEIKRLYQIGATTKVNVTLQNKTTLQNGLVGHWTFDQPDMNPAVKDKSGGGYTLYLSEGFTSTTTVPGKIGQALKFDGGNDVVGASSTPVTTAPLTLCAWYRGGSATVFLSDGDGGGLEDGFALYGGRAFTLANGVSNGTGAPKFDSKVWNHSCAVFKTGNQEEVYLNGGNPLTASDNTPSGVNQIEIGRYSEAGFAETFNGDIDDVRIYNRALSAQEILKLYQLGQ